MARKPKVPKDFVVKVEGLSLNGLESMTSIHSADGILLRLTFDFGCPAGMFGKDTHFSNRLFCEMKDLAELKERYASFVMGMGVIDSDKHRNLYGDAVRREATMAFAIQALEQHVATLKAALYRNAEPGGNNISDAASSG